MQKLIPTIYFYTVSLIGIILLVIGTFNSIHFLAGITLYDQYPLGYSAETRCMPAGPTPGSTISANSVAITQCLEDVKKERQEKKASDAEKAISFTLIGLLVFSIHFYFARKQK